MITSNPDVNLPTDKHENWRYEVKNNRETIQTRRRQSTAEMFAGGKSKYALKVRRGNQMYGPGCCAHKTDVRIHRRDTTVYHKKYKEDTGEDAELSPSSTSSHAAINVQLFQGNEHDKAWVDEAAGLRYQTGKYDLLAQMPDGRFVVADIKITGDRK